MKFVPAKAVDDGWFETLSPREQSLLKFILAQDPLQAALAEGPIIELRASGDDLRNSLLPMSASIEVNSGNAVEAQTIVRKLKGGLNFFLIRNVLQFLTETRQFLGLCFSKLSVGG